MFLIGRLGVDKKFFEQHTYERESWKTKAHNFCRKIHRTDEKNQNEAMNQELKHAQHPEDQGKNTACQPSTPGLLLTLMARFWKFQVHMYVEIQSEIDDRGDPTLGSF